MKRQIIILVLFFIFSGRNFILSAQNFSFDLRLPFSEGEKWKVSQGYNTSFTHKGKDKYALDFNLTGEQDYGKSILAAADGKVYAKEQKDKKGLYVGYGKYIDIDHGEYVTRYAHLLNFAAESGQEARQGEVIGYADNTGTSIGTHLHFALYKKEIREDKEGKKVTKYHPLKPEPMSGYSHFAAGKSYLSDNRLFKKGVEDNKKLVKEESKIIKKDSSSESLKKESKPKEKDKEKKKKESREIETKKIERKDELKKKEKNDPKSLVLKPVLPTSKDSKEKKDSKEEKPKENLEKQSKEPQFNRRFLAVNPFQVCGKVKLNPYCELL